MRIDEQRKVNSEKMKLKVKREEQKIRNGKHERRSERKCSEGKGRDEGKGGKVDTNDRQDKNMSNRAKCVPLSWR